MLVAMAAPAESAPAAAAPAPAPKKKATDPMSFIKDLLAGGVAGGVSKTVGAWLATSARNPEPPRPSTRGRARGAHAQPRPACHP